MSNAMRMGKRTLAGVAAGALGLALIPFVGTTSASAVTGAATVSPVRVTTAAGSLQAVPYASAIFKAPMADSTSVNVENGPAGGTVRIKNATGDDSVVNVGGTVANTGWVSQLVADDSQIQLKATVAGTYSGSIFNGTDTFTFNFATTGAAASMTLTPSSASLPVGGVQTLTVELKDANGNRTQPASTDSITLSASPSANTSFGDAALSADDLRLGTLDDTFSATVAGTYVVSATPLGTLPSGGVTTQQSTVSVSGTVSTNAVTDLQVSVPANAWNEPGTDIDAKNAQVPAGTAAVTVAIDDTTVNPAGTTLRFRARAVANSTVNGVAYPGYAFVNVVTNAQKKATAEFALGGNALLTAQALVVEQVNAANGLIAGDPKITVTQTAATNYVISASPDDSVVAQLGASVPVTLTVVDDTFQIPQVGWAVTAGRGTTAPGVVLATGTTNAAGQVTLNVSGAAGITTGTVEKYSFVGSLAGSSTGTSGNDLLQVTYTTSGAVTAMNYEQGAGNPANSAIDSLTTVTKGALVRTPGVASNGLLIGAPTTQGFNISTGADDTTVAASIGFYTSLKTSTTPANAATYTAPEGVFITDDTTTATWSNGASTLTVSNGRTVYVYGTKTGVHDITITSGGQTLTAKVKVVNSATDAYNINVTPEEQSVARGAIGTATLTVTDIFGNPVQTVDNVASGSVTVSASGEVLLAGFRVSDTFATNANGQASITFIAGNAAGQGVLTATPTPVSDLAQWTANPPFDPPAGAPAPVTSAAATIGVGEAPIEPAMLISGERQNRRIVVEGETVGLPNLTIVRPWIRFPGQVGFTQGAAERAVLIYDEDEQLGVFAWQRNTGKRTAVQFRTADGLRSNSIIIPAR